MGFSELEYVLLSPGEEATSIRSYAENAREEWGYSRFAVIETRRGSHVADASHLGEEAQKNRIGCSALQGAIEFLSAVLAAME